MPIRSETISPRLSTLDLPILPFLAPRIFTSWPSRDNSTHPTRGPVRKRITIRAIGHESVHKPCLRVKTSVRMMNSSACRRRHDNWTSESREPGEPHASGSDAKELEAIMNQALEEDSEPIQEDFLRRYKETWGGRSLPESFEPSIRRIAKNLSKTAFFHQPPQHDENSEFHKDHEIEQILISMKNEAKAQAQSRPWAHLPEKQVQTGLDYADEKYQDFVSRSGERTGKTRIWRPYYWLSIKPQHMKPRDIKPIGRSHYYLQLDDKAPTAKSVVATALSEIIESKRLTGRKTLPSTKKIWQINFAKLGLEGCGSMQPNSENLGILSNQEIEKLGALGSMESISKKTVKSASRIWAALPEDVRQLTWPKLMIVALKYRPATALKFILATHHRKPSPPRYAISDSLNYIIAWYLRYSHVDRKPHNAFQLQKKYTELLFSDFIELSQDSLFLLMAHLEVDKLKEFYYTLKRINHKILHMTLIQFASRFAKSGETDLSFQILQELQVSGRNLNSAYMVSLCSTILSRQYRGVNVCVSELEMFQYMLSKGLRPNVITYNILIQNALQVGDHHAGWQIHDLMIESNMDPDSITYSLLLNDAKWRMDSQAIDSVLSHVRQRDIWSSYIATSILHSIYLLSEGKDKNHTRSLVDQKSALGKMVQVYREYYHMKPLIQIFPGLHGMFPDLYSPESDLNHEITLTNPSVPTLHIMISAILQALDAHSITEFYGRFVHLLMTNDPAVAGLGSQTYFWNSFLLALSKFPETFRESFKIVSFMLQHSGSDETSSQKVLEHKDLEDTKWKSNPTEELQTGHNPINSSREKSRDFRTPAPDIYTWSILLNMFVHHGQPRAAEKVLSAMRLRGVEPNQITWNSLTFAYTSPQDPLMTADVINRMAEAGFKPDEVTMKSLAKFRDRRTLIEAMKKTKIQKYKDSQLGLGQSLLAAVRSEKIEVKGSRTAQRVSLDESVKSAGSDERGHDRDSSTITDGMAEVFSDRKFRHSKTCNDVQELDGSTEMEISLVKYCYPKGSTAKIKRIHRRQMELQLMREESGDNNGR